jgi:hypothetical protein
MQLSDNTLFLSLFAGLRLQNGRKYSVEVTALNKAKLATKHESHGVIVDTSPPIIDNVSIVGEQKAC